MSLSTLQRRRLRALIGQCVCYHGTEGQIIEFLDQEQALVLELGGLNQRLQAGQYGEPGRQVKATKLLPIFDPDAPGQFNHELHGLDISLPL